MSDPKQHPQSLPQDQDQTELDLDSASFMSPEALERAESSADVDAHTESTETMDAAASPEPVTPHPTESAMAQVESQLADASAAKAELDASEPEVDADDWASPEDLMGADFADQIQELLDEAAAATSPPADQATSASVTPTPPHVAQGNLMDQADEMNDLHEALDNVLNQDQAGETGSDAFESAMNEAQSFVSPEQLDDRLSEDENDAGEATPNDAQKENALAENALEEGFDDGAFEAVSDVLGEANTESPTVKAHASDSHQAESVAEDVNAADFASPQQLEQSRKAEHAGNTGDVEPEFAGAFESPDDLGIQGQPPAKNAAQDAAQNIVQGTATDEETVDASDFASPEDLAAQAQDEEDVEEEADANFDAGSFESLDDVLNSSTAPKAETPTASGDPDFAADAFATTEDVLSGQTAEAQTSAAQATAGPDDDITSVDAFLAEQAEQAVADAFASVDDILNDEPDFEGVFAAPEDLQVDLESELRERTRAAETEAPAPEPLAAKEATKKAEAGTASVSPATMESKTTTATETQEPIADIDKTHGLRAKFDRQAIKKWLDVSKQVAHRHGGKTWSVSKRMAHRACAVISKPLTDKPEVRKLIGYAAVATICNTTIMLTCKLLFG